MQETHMKLLINGQHVEIEQPRSVISDVLSQYLSIEQQALSYAIALNNEFVSKADYKQTFVQQGDSIDVLFPIQGG